MALLPYRTAATPAPDSGDDPPGEAARLGALRSVHAAVPLRRSLPRMLGLVAFVVVAVFLQARNAPELWWVLLPTLGLGLPVLAWPAVRRRGLSIALHAGGVVVEQRGRRDAVVFEDVDEVWLVLEPERSPFGTIAHIMALRLVDRSGVTHPVSLEVERSVDVTQWVLRACSEPLLPEARSALSAGDPLRFGRIEIDREGITVGSAKARWEELRLVRLQPGRVALFRRWPVFPWKTVNLDEVPHPTVFTRLVAERAPRVETDDPLRAAR